MGFWENMMPGAAKHVAARKIYAVTKRGSVVEEGGPESYALQFYPRSDSPSLVSIPFEQIQTGHSEDDNPEKWLSTVLIFGLIAGPALSVWFREALPISADGLGYYGALFALAAAILVFAVFVNSMLKVNFVKMDTRWSNSIREFLDNDMQNKLQGIGKCMLAFRRFVKWRRFMTYALWLVPVAIAAELFFLEYVLLAADAPVWSPDEMGFAAFFGLMAAVALARYSWLRWYYTDFRDPTLQLCVMLAEENRNYVGLLRRGVRI